MLDYARLGRMAGTEIQALQDRTLARAITDRVYPCHRYYRRLMEEAGLGPADLAGIAGLARLPFTDRLVIKQEGDPRAFVLDLPPETPPARRGLFGLGGREPRAPSVDPSRPLRAMFAGGRTTPLTPIFYAQQDLDHLVEAGRRVFQVAGVDTGQPLVNAIPYGPGLPFWQIAAATLDQGVTAVQTGGPRVMDVEKTLSALVNLKAATLAGFPGFLAHLLRVGAGEGIRLERLQRVLVTGEPLTEGFREHLRRLLAEVGSAAEVLGLYLNTEAKTGWAECAPGTGFHTNPDLEFLEIIDPDEGERLGPGETGELVITHLDARGTFLLRYRTGDVVEGGLTVEPCPACGRTVPRLGSLVYPAAEAPLVPLRKCLDESPAVTLWQLAVSGGEVALAVSPAGIDPAGLPPAIAGLRRVEALPESELHRRLGTDREPREARIVLA
ncbi:MAG: hypothetical protein RDU89_10105 [bacterium]|nr:hypothetical protein [bacterium]